MVPRGTPKPLRDAFRFKAIKELSKRRKTV